MKVIVSGILDEKIQIKRNNLPLKKIAIKINKKGEEKIVETLIYPNYDKQGYLTYDISYKDVYNKTCKINIKAYRLFDMVFNDNEDILRNRDVDHKDRIRCFCMPENLRMVTSKINQNNKGACENKID
jgi:hypothetical protein